MLIIFWPPGPGGPPAPETEPGLSLEWSGRIVTTMEWQGEIVKAMEWDKRIVTAMEWEGESQ